MLPVVIDCIPFKMPGLTKSGFQTTRWTLVQLAASSPTRDARRALSTLFHTYWRPVYAFVRRNGYDPDQSRDLTQGFFALLLEKKYLADADQKRGRFRSFLLTAVKHFLANEWNRAQAVRRGGGQLIISIDLVEAERWYVPSVVEKATPETLFERRWALSILEKVMARLQAEFVNAGKADQFEILSLFLNQDSDDIRYAELAGQINMTVGAMRMSVHRMRRRYRRLLREEITETVARPNDIDDEIRFLVSTLST
jgi:DNA-directed RNA polymerase specialized sigma24 family protein